MMLVLLIDNYVILMIIDMFLMKKEKELRQVRALIEHRVYQFHYNHYKLIIASGIYH
jgi:hypothetical protein